MTHRIAVVGAGAVGGYVGAGLAASGHDVTLIDPWPVHVEAIRAGGMRLSGMTPEETRTVRVPALHLTDVQRIAREAPIDIAFVSVKSVRHRMGDDADRALPLRQGLRGVDAELCQ